MRPHFSSQGAQLCKMGSVNNPNHFF